MKRRFYPLKLMTPPIRALFTVKNVSKSHAIEIKMQLKSQQNNDAFKNVP